MKKTYAIMLLLLTGILAGAQEMKMMGPPPGTRMQPILRTDQPVVSGRDVTFTLMAPEAKEVIIFGDFIPGKDIFGLGGSVEMVKGPEGVWTYTARNLAPNFYFYFFVVDGVKTLDPWNIAVVHNYKEHLNTFIIEGEEMDHYKIADGIPKGALMQVWYPSKATGHDRRANVYLPYGYNHRRKYDVLYLQHGGGDDEETWVTLGRMCQIMDHLIAAGKCKPMIVVLPNGWDNQQASMNIVPPYKDIEESKTNGTNRSGGEYVNDLVYNLIPYIESHFNVKKGAAHRAISALSLGVTYTLYTIQHYPDMFDYVAIMGSALRDDMDLEEVIGPIWKNGYKLFWMGAGKTDLAYNQVARTMEEMDQAGMPYVYFDSGDGHNWRSWRRNLMDFVPLLFK